MPKLLQIPGIELVAELGRGAYSVVYTANQGSQRCAVKVPRAKGRWSRWVYREAVALARVRDPGLPTVLEVGVVDEQQPYIVMELVEGETLADRLRQRRMAEGEAIELAMTLARTLAAVHDAGLVHRDVKPRNIVVEESGRVRLVDFGFAAPLEGVPDDTAGTPRYAAPEQFRAPIALDGRSDLYALGRVLFEAMVGELRAVSRVADPDVPSKVDAELRAVGISEELTRVVRGLLALDAADRYPDARSLYRDLDLVRTEKRSLGPVAYERTRRHPTTVLRGQELQRVADVATKATSGAGAMIRIEGGPGSGKSAFIAACAGRIERSRVARVADVRCRAADPPLAAIGRLLDGLAMSLRHGGRAAAFAAAASPFLDERMAGVATMLSPSLAAILNLKQTGNTPLPSGFAESAADFVVRLARAERLVIVVDDAQWLDPASREILLCVRFRLREEPIVLVLATRPTETASLGEAERAQRFSEPEAEDLVLKLAPLTETQIAALVASHLGVPEAEPTLAARVAALADDTPLGVLEVLRALLDVGAVRPHAGTWTLDVARAERVALPAGAAALLDRRVGELPPAARRVLEAAAVLDTEFEDRLLEELLDLRRDELAYGLADGVRAGLVTIGERGRHRFVHDSLRELLLAELSTTDARALHQRVAEILSARKDPSLEDLVLAARHFAAGDLDSKPKEACRSALLAARAAVSRFDHETALGFFDFAQRAADRAKLELGSDYFRDVGEVNLRLGRVDQAARSFREALLRAEGADVRARMHGRIAWVQQTRDDPDAAWSALENAFRELGVQMPTESVRSGVETLGRMAMSGIRHIATRPPKKTARSIGIAELLSDLYYQNARLALEYGKPLRLVQSTLRAVEACEPLGRSRALARATALKGGVMTVLGSHAAGTKALQGASALAESLGDPQTTAFCAQLRWLGECFAGHLDEALVLIDEFLEVHGPWLELAEFCHGAANADYIASVRGRPDYGWPRLHLAVERIRRSGSATAAIEDWVMHRARADLAALGRSVEGDLWLSKAFARVASSPAKPATFLGVLAWGPRARAFVEAGDLGADFERLVQSFEAEGYRPSTAHPLLAEYYIAIAQARMHQSFGDPHHKRRARLPALKKAAGDLRQAAKLALFRAHAALIDAHIAWLEENPAEMREAIAEAENLADAEACAWVLYGVERLRGHALLASGKRPAAVDRARLAETIALEHGAVRRARWVRDEFGLTTGTTALTPTSAAAAATTSWLSSTSSSRHRQLAALLHAVHAPQANLTPEQQAISVLDELLADFDAEHAFLYFGPADSSTPLRIGRTRGGTPWTDLPDGRFGLIEAVRERGEIWPPPAHEGESTTLLREITDGRVVVAPLSLYETTVGAVLIERAVDARPFGDDERQLLGVLMHQIPIALELARVLAEREELELSLRQARKMEAVGQLAGGVAHDFNNMLQAIRAAAEVVRGSAGLGADAVDEIEVISQAADRATSLTRQLLTFSRHRPAPLTTHGLDVLLAELEPLLKRVGAKHVSVALSIAPDPMFVRVDRPALEQAIVNLIKNAGDAMPDGGTVTVSASAVDLDVAAVRRGAPKPGPYVALRVADHGHGIKPELLERIFEPFFTTKAFGSNTGLGLTTVYAFAKNSGGYVEVSSAVGRGTTVSLFLPRVAARPTSMTPPPRSRPVTIGKGELILVVDDEPLVARSTCKILERNGFQVIVAGGGQEALDAVRNRTGDIRLSVIDVVMPDMSGPEVARRLVQIGITSRCLFVSGYAASESDAEADELLQKPFTPEELVARVRGLIDDNTDPRSRPVDA